MQSLDYLFSTWAQTGQFYVTDGSPMSKAGLPNPQSVSFLYVIKSWPILLDLKRNLNF